MDRKEGLAPRIDAFKLCCWRRLLRAPWTARRSNQSILKKKKNQLCIFIGRNEAEDEAPILWPLDVKSWIIGKDYDTWERLKAGRVGSNKE